MDDFGDFELELEIKENEKIWAKLLPHKAKTQEEFEAWVATLPEQISLGLGELRSLVITLIEEGKFSPEIIDGYRKVWQTLIILHLRTVLDLTKQAAAERDNFKE